MITPQNDVKPLKFDAETGELLEEKVSLPCLYSNNSIENEDFRSNKLSVSQKRSSIALSENVQYMASKYGLNYLAFLTLTFKDNVTNMREAQRRFNSFSTNFLRSQFLGHIAVKERTKAGRIHFHLVVASAHNLRSGFNFDDIAKCDYSSANPAIKREWAMLRSNAPKYGFGRTELLPIKSTSEAIGRYVGKYISKNVQERPDEDKGTRLVNYSGDSRAWNTQFMPVTEGSAQWRKNIPVFLKLIAKARGLPPLTERNVSKQLGKHWAYEFREFIINLSDETPIDDKDRYIKVPQPQKELHHEKFKPKILQAHASANTQLGEGRAQRRRNTSRLHRVSSREWTPDRSCIDTDRGAITTINAEGWMQSSGVDFMSAPEGSIYAGALRY